MLKKIRTHWLRWLTPMLLLLALVFGAAGPARAVEIDDDGVIAAGETVDDDVVLSNQTVTMDGTVNGVLLAGGETVTVNGDVNGDVIAWGNDIVINGRVNGNVFAGGGLIVINGPITGSVFVVANAIRFDANAAVARNVYCAGFSCKVGADATVGLDAMLAGYQALVEGKIGRDLNVASSALEISGRVGRNVKAEVDAPEKDWQAPPPHFMPPNAFRDPMIAPGLRVAESAVIGGKLAYASTVEQAEAIRSKPENGVEFQQIVKDTGDGKPKNQGAMMFEALVAMPRSFITLLALGCLLVWLMPAFFRGATEQLRAKPLPSAGWGLVTLVLGFAGAVVLAVVVIVFGILIGMATLNGLTETIFGLGFSGLGFAFAIFMFLVNYASILVVAYLLGRIILKWVWPAKAEHRFWPLVTGVLAYVLIRDNPLMHLPGLCLGGWLIGAIATLLGLGAIWLMFRAWWQARRAVPAETETLVPPTA